MSLPLAPGDRRYAADAALWLEHFYPGMRASVAGDRIELSAADDATGAHHLERTWSASLLNERCHAENFDDRRDIISKLVE